VRVRAKCESQRRRRGARPRRSHSTLRPPPTPTGLKVPPLGFGAWSWGDRSNYWGYGKDYDKTANQTAFDALQKCAVDGTIPGGRAFVDTAEVYGYGLSETFLGEFIKADQSNASKPFIMTKFAPLPWRVARSQVVSAAKASAERLQVDCIDAYIQHWVGFATSAFSNDAFLEGLADVYDQGLAKSVGVSNFRADRVHRAADALERRGSCLACNQVQYSLLYRAPETNGVMEACRERGVTLVAYSPLTQGLLSGKYAPGKPLPSGPRGAIYRGKINEIGKLIDLMTKIGEERGGKTPAQVALNWLMCQPGVLPIPGAKTAKQVEELAGSCGWRLTDAEWEELDRESKKVKPPLGAPFENW
jgi:aryl-alcohol dehydrogenase-like predicted oxidoreductase